MRVCVYGAGAIGGHLAMRFARGGAEVSVVARGPHLAAIQANGLTVHAVDGQFNVRVHAADDPAALGPQDAVVVTVKAPSLPQVAAGIGPLLRPDTGVAFVMNGIPWWYFHALPGALEGRRLPRIDPDDVLWRGVGPERAIGGVVYAASEVTAPGVIDVEQPKSRVVFGEPDGRVSDRAEALAALLRAGGIAGEASPDIRTELWNKLINNLAGGTLAVLAGVAPRHVYAEAACAAAGKRVMQEAAAVAEALGSRPNHGFDQRIAGQKGMDHKPSILQDLELGRPMEVDGLFDAPVALAQMAGVAVPTMELLVALAKVRARGAGLYGG
ncbi:MAG TPA: 2-dehydropantoate 2-reductase [Acetobacteraceae bacterium]|jgi:2-dehydropantoate 2-reductase